MTTAVALALTAIGGIASAAQAAPAGAPHLSLHNLHLINGWQSAAPKFRTSGPAYAIQDGVVYLNGSITQPSPGDPVFAVLPKAARPAHRMWVTDYTIEGSTGILVISTNGMMTATSSDPDNNAAQFTSIAGVSFPARSTTLHKLALRNGWQSDQHAFLSGDPSYTVRNGIVHLAGSLSHPRAGGPEFAVLPKGARLLFTSLASISFPVPSVTVR